MIPSRRAVPAGAASFAAPFVPGRATRAQAAPLRFAVGPFQPTAGDTRRVYEPFFAHLAAALGRPFEPVVTTDWAGIAVALADEQARGSRSSCRGASGCG